MSNSTTRFSDRVGDYVKYRPHYPREILTCLRDTIQFNHSRIVADIGSGTGISTELFLQNGNTVYGVEPNREMRTKAEELLAGHPGFISVNGTAEQTGLQAHSVELIVAGQAFHWFDPLQTREEFKRIARPGSYVALIWNERQMLSDFEKEYEDLILEYAGDYKTINHKNITDLQIGIFFHPMPFAQTSFENEQLFDLTGLKGRLLSSSYIPKETHPRYEAMMRDLARVFGKHQSGGQVRVGYETKLYTGTMG